MSGTESALPLPGWILRLAAALVLLAALVYVGLRGVETWQTVSASGLWARVAGWLLPAALFYTALVWLLALGWAQCNRLLSGQTPSRAKLMRIYLLSQIAKYLPGNVLHFAGRHALGVQAGMAHGLLLRGALLENVLLMGSAAGLSLLAAGLGLRAEAGLFFLPAALGLTVLAGAAIVVMLRRGRGLGDGPAARARTRGIVSLSLLYLGFFLLCGTIIVVLATALDAGMDARDAMVMALIFPLAWLAGFLTPGAPAGVGIREAVIIALLAPLAGEAAAVVLALALRLVTTLGDLAAFAGAWLLRNTLNAERG